MNDPIPFPGADKTSNHAEEALATLRAVAKLPAAEGLEERVKAGLSEGLRAGVRPASANDLPGRRDWMHSRWMRGLAAAAIVMIVVGGGWGAAWYGRQDATQRTIGIPHMAPPGEFSNAGAMRTPQTLTQPLVPKPKRRASETDNHRSKTKAGRTEKPAAKDAQKVKALHNGAPER